MSWRRILGSLVIAVHAIHLSGCSTVYTLSSGVHEPWSGTKLDLYILQSPDASFLRTTGAALDYPFSLVGDAVVLAFLQPGGVEPFLGPD